MPSTPDQLLEQATRHAAHLERLKSQDVRVLRDLLRLIETDLIGRVARSNPGSWSMARASKQLGAFQKLLSKRYGKEILPELRNQIAELAEYEAGFEMRSLQKVAPSVSFDLPGKTQLLSAIRTQPFSAPGPLGGQLLEPFLRDWTRQQVRGSINVIRGGFAEGLTTPQIISRMRDISGPVSRRGLETLTRTALQHTAVQAREMTWKSNSDIVKRVRWVSTLDSRTSTICRTLDTQVYKLDEGPRPPIHPNCRSTTVAVLDDRFAFLEEGGTRRARDPQTGEVGSAPAEESYYSWLKRQPAKVQNSIVGNARGKLLRDGGLTSQRFAELQLGKHFEPLSLADMRELEPVAFMRAGLN